MAGQDKDEDLHLSMGNEIQSRRDDNEIKSDECGHDRLRRLSGLESPTVGKRPKKRRTQDSKMVTSEPAVSKSQGAGSGRKLGKLAQLMNMPLDVFFEITGHLEPLDILRLSRVSKQFRATFASKHSRHIWLTARRNIHMPECPSDLTELQFASLMFEQNCQACGSRAYKVDHSLRVRFCGPCFEANVQAGTKILKRHRMVACLPDLIFTLLPRSSLQNPNNYSASPFSRWSSIPGGDAKTNRRQNAYYVPEMEMIIKRYQELKTDPTTLKHFVDHQQNLSSQMMDTATHLAEWAKMRKSQKAFDSCERMQNREASIEAKLLELGWERNDFPSEWEDSKWHALMKQPRELTPHLWKTLRPKLEARLEEHKRAQAETVIRIRRDQREQEFDPFWVEFVLSHPWDPAQPWSLPRFVDACELPAIDRMLAEDESRIPVTAERWQAVVGSVPNDINRFANQVMQDIVKLLKVAPSETNTAEAETAIVEDAHEDVDPSIFKRASSLLSCGATGCRNLYTFPEILEDEHVTPYRSCNFDDRKWPDLLSRLKHEPEVFRCASLVLKTLGLPEDTSIAAFDSSDRKLLCLCGNPKFQKPMDFRSLVRHVADENTTYESQVRTRRDTSYSRDLKLHNDHDLTGSDPCVALLSFDDVLASDTNGFKFSSYRSYDKYCKDCWILNLRLHAMREDDDIAYHMKAKHLKEPCDEDVLPIWQLKRWKKKHPDH